MKKVTLFATMILALAMSASAEDMIDFTQLAPATTPQPITNPYHNLTWTAIDYVSAELYNNWLTANGFDAGAGLVNGPEAQVAIIGGPLCYDKSKAGGYNQNEYPGTTTMDVCRGSISSADHALFAPDYVYASEGWTQDGNQFVTVEAYLAGKKIGSQKFNLQSKAQKFKLVLPNEWGQVSELVFWPSPGGSVVLYVVHMK